MEAAIENATQQTAQDLHMLLDQAQGPSPSAGPLATPLGKENMAAPAGSGDTKKRAAAGAAPLSMLALQGGAAEPCLHALLHLYAICTDAGTTFTLCSATSACKLQRYRGVKTTSWYSPAIFKHWHACKPYLA